MQKKKILTLVPMKEDQLALLKEIAPNYDVISKVDVDKKDTTIEIMYGWDEEISPQILSFSQNQIKWVQAQSAGVDHIDMAPFESQSILLSNASGVHGNQMSESILGMIFAYTRGLQTAILNQSEKRWDKPKMQTDLEGKNIMILGTGHIGERLAEILNVFQVHLVGVNRSKKQVPHFDEIIVQDKIEERISDMDIIINLLPDTKETHYFFTKKLFSQMKQGVMFINAGRGGTVKTTDLIEACQTGQIGFAGLDVFEEEPLPKENPLWKLENVLITPHSSGMTDKYFDRLFPIFLDNLKEFIQTERLVKNEVKIR
ncbi:NAD(P)-dependent oxidoreductase [Vagococcus carniphilus]|uniref:NAD(P)-dependent oxidoreductase n=1 Tax=Vagococcus carniphilus TaxID=218144 RepID=UPI003BABA09B